MYNKSLYYICSFSLLSMSLVMFSTLFYLLSMNLVVLMDWDLFSLSGVSLVYSIVIDWISAVFLGVVFLISGAVMFYSQEYMAHGKMKVSFCLIVFLFVVSMMFLIISPNLISVILGWDGLGLVSYLLVVYYQSYKSYGAGMITCLTNRLGDSALLVAMGWFMSSGSLEFLFYYPSTLKEVQVSAMFIVLAAMTKSAQVPFSAWLPAAMAAPTPVSALVHSSTLVTAGVYLLVRFYPIFSCSWMNNILLSLGFMTLLISSLSAFYEMDLKKVIALSTLSQLGVMMVSLGLKLHLLAFFHLLSHALFKASLFLSAGSVIHFYGGSQDIRHLGKVAQSMPFTISCLMVCSFALSGIPFLAAFYSKDKIIEESLVAGSVSIFSLMMMSIVCTMIYSMRLLFFLSSSEYEMSCYKISDSSLMLKSIFLLTLGGIFGGSLMSWSIFSFSYDSVSSLVKSGMLSILFTGSFVGVWVKFIQPSNFIYFLSAVWVSPNVTATAGAFGSLKYGDYVYKNWDNGWSETVGPQGLMKESLSFGKGLNEFAGFEYKAILFVSFICLLLLMCIIY